MEGELLVEQVKELQRNDQTFREQWGAYCDAHGEGIRDPNKQDVMFIQTFLAQYSAGMRFECSEKGDMPGLFKEGQRKSSNWKYAWASYCQTYGGGINDPKKHEASFLVGFLDFLGQRGQMAISLYGLAAINASQVASGSAAGGGGGATASSMARDKSKTQCFDCGEYGHWANDPVCPRPGADALSRKRDSRAGGMGGGGGGDAAKRQRLGVGGAPGRELQVSTGDPVKDQLILRIKAYQRQGEDQKTEWGLFCDNQLGGIRDPARHEVAVLQQFLLQHASNAGMVDQAPAPGTLMSCPDPFKAELVAKLKAFQRQSEEQKNAWGSYCDTNLGGIRDPNRHDAPVLATFLANFGIS